MRLACFILTLVILGCSKPRACFTPPQPTPLRFVNDSGQDLLNPSTANSYSISNIRISYFENGSIKHSKVSIDSIPGANTFFLTNDLPWFSHNGQTFYLQLSNADVDTIYMRSDKMNGNDCTYFQVKEFRYNNVVQPLKFFTGGPAAYEITK
jgi:hypothetical protein